MLRAKELKIIQNKLTASEREIAKSEKELLRLASEDVSQDEIDDERLKCTNYIISSLAIISLLNDLGYGVDGDIQIIK